MITGDIAARKVGGEKAIYFICSDNFSSPLIIACHSLGKGSTPATPTILILNKFS